MQTPKPGTDRPCFTDEAGSRQRVTPETEVVESGTLIYAGKNNWAPTGRTVTRFLVITGFINALAATASDLADVAGQF